MNVRRMNTMERISKYFVQGVHSFSGPFHPFGGAVDIIVVQQQDGSLKSSPWNVTFGKFQGVLKTKENVVNISVNGTEAGFHMYLDQKGQAYFLNEVDGEEGDSVYTATSSGGETVGQSQRGRLIKSKSCNFEVDQPDHGAQVDMSSRKIVKQTNSSRSRISGLVFGQKSYADDYREGEGNGPVMERVNSLERAEIAADLLEMRWSTNLSTDKHRKDRASRLSALNSPVKKADKDLLVDDKQIQVSPLGGNNLYTSSDHPALHKETGSPVREMGNKSEHDKEFSEYLVDLTRSEVSRPSSEEQVFMLSTSEAMDIEDNQGVSFEISGGMGEIGLENASVVEMTEGVTSKVIPPNSHGPGLAAIEEIASNMTNTALPSDETGVPFSRFGVSREDCGNKGVQSYICCKTSESSREGVDDTSKRAFEALNLSQSSDLNALEERASTMTNTALASDEREGIFSRPGVYTEESAKERVGSLVHCETSECSRVGMDGTNEKAVETLSYSCEGCEELQVHAVSPYMTTDLISEVNSQKESGFIIAREELDDSRVLNDENSCKYPNTKTICHCDGTSGYPITKNVVEESLSLPDTHLVSSNSIEDDMNEVVSHDSVTEMLIQEENLETKLVGGFESQYHTKDLFFACISQNSEVELEKPCTPLEPIIQMVNSGQSSGSVELAESQKICRHSGLYNSSYSVQDQEIQVEEENKMEIIIDSPESGIDFALSDRILIVPSQSLDGNRCHSNDIDNFVSDRFQCQDSFPLNAIDTDSHPSVSLGGFEDGNVSVNINLDPSLSSDMVAQECPSNGFEDLNEDSMVVSSPIDIPICAMGVGNGVERMVKSLPNFRSHIDNLEKSDFLHPLSHSLDSNPEISNWVLPTKDVTISLRSDEESKHQLLQGQPRMEDIQMLEELKNASSNHAVEISLCKHLLYEGMGADAASQAFAAEKVDLEKFSSLGPMLLKNNKLVVKIRGFYLPWDAAAPHILGMVAFGLEHSFQPIGMFPVDHVKTTLEGDSSRAIVASNGTWKLWPFSLRRSRNVSSGLPALSGMIGSSDAANASQSTHEMTKDKDTINAKTTKKKVQSLVPTSEQLASLNLKEGRNIVTFTFSTSMLGKQQVDARIYLWKLNTRIVVSDVDGTITKSDVLGQFMPLVGKDWSQTGVAHLFSAIKENGYQFLFLSARAISQADLTRQFLSNIKQDGKVLPDGPILISPDGLFPSLYREVIRRAPHEFKIACLMEIRALFPPDCNPFYAGFGNRHTDEISYLKVEIPKGKIFIINPKGEVAVNRWVDTKSYASLHTLVNGMFPPKSSEGQEDFNQWNYWKMPLPDIDI